MARLYKFCILTIILLLIIEEGYCGKYKKDSKKNKEYKNKGKKGGSALEEGENRFVKQSTKQFQHRRPARSLKEQNFKQIAEEQADEIVYYRPGKAKMLAEENEMQESIEPTYESNMVSCEKKSQCNISQKPRKKAVYVVVDEIEANTRKKGGKTKKILRRVEDSEISSVNGKRQKVNKQQKMYVIPEAEETENIQPQEIEYKIRAVKKNKREKEIPRYMVSENSEPDTFTEEERIYYGKKRSPRIIIESENQMELENTTNEYYVYEEALVKPSSEPNETEEFDDYYPDIL